MSFTGSIVTTVQGTMQNSLDLETAKAIINKRIQQTITNGTGANQAQQHWSDIRTLAGTSETLDLAGALTNAFGSTVTFATLRAIIIRNLSSTAGHDLIVGGAAAPIAGLFGDAASDKLKIRAGGTLVLLAPLDGYTITATSADGLKLDSGANTFNYEIILIGT